MRGAVRHAQRYRTVSVVRIHVYCSYADREELTWMMMVLLLTVSQSAECHEQSQCITIIILAGGALHPAQAGNYRGLRTKSHS